MKEPNLMKIYAVKDALLNNFLGYVEMLPETTSILDLREHDDAVHDVMFEIVSDEEGFRIRGTNQLSETACRIGTVEQFDIWMNG